MNHQRIDPVDWRNGLIEAVDIIAGKQPSQQAHRSQQAHWVCLGETHYSGQDDWFDLRFHRHNPSQNAQLCFGPAEGFIGDEDPATSVYRVENFYEDPTGWHFQPARDLPQTHRHIYYRKEPKGILHHSLQDLVRNSEESAPLADALAKGLLEPIPEPETHPSAKGLTPTQELAYRSCLAHGVRLVWGPPGSGKSRVLANALATLIEAGKRVLLVSTANVAVDNALIKLVTDNSYEPGCVVRAGQAQLPALRENRAVLLASLAQDRTRDAESDVHDLQRKLTALVKKDRSELDQLRVALTDFGHDGQEVEAARHAVKTERGLDRARQELAQHKDQLTKAHRDVDSARQAVKDLENAERASNQARQHLIRATTLRSQLAEMASDLDRLRGEVNRIGMALSTTNGLLPKTKLRLQRRQAQKTFRTAEMVSHPALSELADQIAVEDKAAAPYDREYFDQLDRSMDSANRELGRSRAEVLAQDKVVRDGKASVNKLKSSPRPTGAQREVLARAEAFGYEEKFQRLQTLEREEQANQQLQSDTEKKLATALHELERLRKDAEGHILAEAQVVASTLAYARMHSGLKSAVFDVVLVDEVGMASFGEVLGALSRGTETGVLFGDFLQLSPVFDKSALRSKSDEEVEFVRHWLGRSAFQRLGIDSPEAATDHPGCVTLTHQFRFGSRLRELANELVYEILQDGESLPGMPPNPETRIVIINTSDLGGHEEVIRANKAGVAGWTSAGMLLSRALAGTHLDQGQTVGVVTPYRDQADAIRSAMQDSPRLETVPVGTVHSFQGTEYDVVVFDLVEDGHGWMAKANNDPSDEWRLEGLRLAATAVTRTRQRLYILVDLAATRPGQARNKALMQAVHRGVESGRFETWSAAELLGLEPQSAPVESSIFSAVKRELSRNVEVEAVHDEQTFQSSLARELDKANKSIWMWAPWVASRFIEVEPHLKEAIERGVSVTIFMRTDKSHGQPQSKRFLEQALQLDARIIRVDHEHRKVVVVDEETTMMGSLNPISATTRTREVMLLYRGRAFAERILKELDAEKYSSVEPCPVCGAQQYLWRSASTKSPVYRWRCETCERDKK